MKMLRNSLVLVALCLSGNAIALNSNSNQFSTNKLSIDNGFIVNSLDHKYRSRNRSSSNSVLRPSRRAQADTSSQSLRTKSEVMQEVKKQYNGMVLKMSLNQSAEMYSVRVLLPSGKIKNISVSAVRNNP